MTNYLPGRPPYEHLLYKTLHHGVRIPDRTGTGARSLIGQQMRYDLADGFPLITTKRVHFKSVIGELLWFLSGSTNVNELRDKHGVTIWDEWADQGGELGPVYGQQWRAWGLALSDDGMRVDQITNVIESIKADPHSRRHIVSAWNPAEIPLMALAPCHALFQFFVRDGRLSCQLYQRSADMFLGVPFNIASYALLTHMIAAQTGLEVGEFIWTGGDVHLYENHIEQARAQLTRTPRNLPTLTLDPANNINDYTPDHIHLTGYDPHPRITAPVAV